MANEKKKLNQKYISIITVRTITYMATSRGIHETYIININKLNAKISNLIVKQKNLLEKQIKIVIHFSYIFIRRSKLNKTFV